MPYKPVKYIALICMIFYCPYLHAQKKWIGNNSGGWENAFNWQPAGTPSNSDDVLLDNTFQGNSYIIALPDIAISVHSLVIAPLGGNFIELVLPASNKSSPALIVSGSGDAIIIKKGGLFRNSSGLTSGQSIQLSGSLFIADEGRYIHNSRSAHASDIVANLSARTGTARGIFEFNVPGGSYPISLSNRIFGTLVLSAAASGGTQTYNATGANPVTINGDFLINSGVQFNADLTKDLIVNGDYIQSGGVFNLASQANNNTIKIRGNIKQATSGNITETSGGLPVIELSGNLHQNVSLAGSITNSVALRVSNSNGATLTDHLVLPFRLELVTGTLKTSALGMLTLTDSCMVSGGSYRSYIDGPVKKIGNGDFEFPIGKQGDYAPLKIVRNAGAATDEFTAEYFLANPQIVYGNRFEQPPILRISALEYWSLKRSPGSTSCQITLSVGTYSQATALDKLVVARWDAVNSYWKNEGNSSYSGIATGTITSNVVGALGAFTLASTVANQNPLPLKTLELKGARNRNKIELNWRTGENTPGNYFDVEQSADGHTFALVGSLCLREGITQYKFSCEYNNWNVIYYRLKVGVGTDSLYSNVVAIPAITPYCKIIKMSPVPVTDNAILTVVGNKNETAQLVISDIRGRVIKIFKEVLREGNHEIYLHLADISPGVHIVQMTNGSGKVSSIRFVKR